MSKQPPLKLDPYIAFRDPDSLPRLVQMGMVDMLRRELKGNDPGPDDLVKAFNIICWSLLTAGPGRNGTEARVKVSHNDNTTIALTKLGESIEKERMKKPKPPKKKFKHKGKTVLSFMPFSNKAKMLARWAKALYDDDPAKYSQNWWKVNTNNG